MKSFNKVFLSILCKTLFDSRLDSISTAEFYFVNLSKRTRVTLILCF